MVSGGPQGQRVFVDTSAFFASFNDHDAQHRTAALIFNRLLDERRPLVTSNFVLAETHAIVLSKLGRAVALRVLIDLYGGWVDIARVDEADERRARALLQRYDDKDFSFADATSFVIMERLGITEAFTFDRHFSQYGFQTVGLDR
jgi:predicted nucleic acid-binding protein